MCVLDKWCNDTGASSEKHEELLAITGRKFLWGVGIGGNGPITSAGHDCSTGKAGFAHGWGVGSFTVQETDFVRAKMVCCSVVHFSFILMVIVSELLICRSRREWKLRYDGLAKATGNGM